MILNQKFSLSVLILLSIVAIAEIPFPKEVAAFDFFDIFRRSDNTEESREVNRRTASGSRTEDCEISAPEAPSLTALAPPGETKNSDSQTLEEITSVEEITSISNPTLWFYIPYVDQNRSDGQELEGELNIIDSDRNLVLEAVRYELKDIPGFIRVKVPAELTRDEEYRWYFEVVCDENQPSRNPRADGFITYVGQTEALLSGLEAFPENSYIPYLENGLWHETIDAIATAARTNPDSEAAQALWNEALVFLKMEDINNESILDCCSLTE